MDRNINRVLAAGLVTLLMLTVSCSKNNNQVQKEEMLKGELKILTESKYQTQLKFAADNFKKVHPKVNIDIEVDNNINNKVINNKENAVDIVNIEDQNVQYFIDRMPDFPLDVTDEIGSYKDKILKGKLDNLTIKNKIYGFPWNTCPKLILYRSDIFKKEGINVDTIKTWNDYVEVGKKIKKENGEKFLVNVQDENNNFNIVLASQLGKSYFNKDGKVDFNSKEWVKVLDTSKLLYSQNLLYDVNSKSDFINLSKQDLAISTIAEPSYITDLINGLQEAKGKWSVMKLPAFEPGGNRDVSIGGANLIVNKNSKNTSAAKEFAKFLISDEHIQMDDLNKYGSFPTNTDIYNLVEFNKNLAYLETRAWYLFANSEKKSIQTNYSRYYPSIKDNIKGAFSQANVKDTDSKLILDSLQKNCENIISHK